MRTIGRDRRTLGICSCGNGCSEFLQDLVQEFCNGFANYFSAVVSSPGALLKISVRIVAEIFVAFFSGRSPPKAQDVEQVQDVKQAQEVEQETDQQYWYVLLKQTGVTQDVE